MSEPTQPHETENLSLPFANARVDRVMRKSLDSRKMIRSEVREAMNKWLGKMCREASKIMNRSDKVMIDMYDFKSAIEKWERANVLEIEKERLITSLRKLELDVASLREDFDRRL